MCFAEASGHPISERDGRHALRHVAAVLARAGSPCPRITAHAHEPRAQLQMKRDAEDDQNEGPNIVDSEPRPARAPPSCVPRPRLTVLSPCAAAIAKKLKAAVEPCSLNQVLAQMIGAAAETTSAPAAEDDSAEAVGPAAGGAAVPLSPPMRKASGDPRAAGDPRGGGGGAPGMDGGAAACGGGAMGAMGGGGAGGLDGGPAAVMEHLQNNPMLMQALQSNPVAMNIIKQQLHNGAPSGQVIQMLDNFMGGMGNMGAMGAMGGGGMCAGGMGGGMCAGGMMGGMGGGMGGMGGGMGGNPMAAMMGGGMGGGGGGAPNMAGLAQMMNNPGFQQMMQAMMTDPQAMQAMQTMMTAQQSGNPAAAQAAVMQLMQNPAMSGAMMQMMNGAPRAQSDAIGAMRHRRNSAQRYAQIRRNLARSILRNLRDAGHYF